MDSGCFGNYALSVDPKSTPLIRFVTLPLIAL
jgi:hypothetical protein